jgi:hypothetical protein
MNATGVSRSAASATRPGGHVGPPAGELDRMPFIQWVLQAVLEAEMTDFIGAAPGKRSPTRKGHRAGHRVRSLATSGGSLALKIPRDRARRFATELPSRFPTEEAATIAALTDMRVLGVSTGRVRAMAERLCGHGFSDEAIVWLESELSARFAPIGCSRPVEVCAESAHNDRPDLASSGLSPGRPMGSSGPAGDPPKTADAPAGAPMALQASELPTSDPESFARVEALASSAEQRVGAGAPRTPLRTLGRSSWVIAGLAGVVVLAGHLYGSWSGVADAPEEPLRAISPPDSVPARSIPMLSPTRGSDPSTPPESTVVAPSSPRTSFQLLGVIATPKPSGNGVALIAIDGSSPLAFRVGAVVEGKLVLLAVTREGAVLGPAHGPATVTLEVTPRETGSGDPRPARETLLASLGQSSAAGDEFAAAAPAARNLPDAVTIGRGPAIRNSPGRRLRLNR